MSESRPAMGSNKPVIVSTCLLGIKSRYNGEVSLNAEATKAIDAFEDAGSYILPVCPEQMGGLSTPREPACIVGGSGADVLTGRATVITASGEDVTVNFIRGAEVVLWLARTTGAQRAILKERSPSCGVKYIHASRDKHDEKGNNTYKECNEVRAGSGVTTALLQEEGLLVLGY